MIQVKESKNHYINATALSFGENDLENPNRVAVSLVGGAAILVHVKGTIDYASDGNFRSWTLKGYSTKLATNNTYYIYARLDRSAPEALITFSANRYALDGSIEGDSSTAPSTRYWYVRIGQLTETDGVTNRELTYDSGLLGTTAVNNAANDILSKAFVFHFDDKNDPDKLTSIEALAGLWTEQFLSAKGMNSGGGSSEGGATTLGGLRNVAADADNTFNAAKMLVLEANSNLWTLKNLSELVGLDEDALAEYLTNNNYAKKGDIPTIPTKVSAFDNDANYATTSDLDARIDALVNGAPAAYDTLKEIADVLANNINSIDDILTALGTKVSKDDFNTAIANVNNSISALNTELSGKIDLKLDAATFNELFEKVKIDDNTYAIRAKLGLFSDGFISAKGSNVGGTSSEGGAVALYQLNDVLADGQQVSGAQDGAVFVYDGKQGKWKGIAQSEIVPNLTGYATESWVKAQGYLTGITSALVTGALGYTPYNAANFTKANIKSTLGISDWALASSKPSYTTTEVTEGTNLYFTNARAVSALKSITDGLGGDISTLQGYFTNGVAKSAARLSTNTAYKAWGQTFFENGVPKAVSGALTDVTDITSSGTITTKKIVIGDGSIEWDSENKGFKIVGGLYTETYLSSKGANPNGGSSGGGLITSLYRYADLGKTFADTNNDTFNAYTINKINTDLGNRISVLEGKATNVSFTQSLTSGTQIGSISIDGVTKNIYAPTIPTSDINKGVTAYGWGNHASVGYLTSASSLAWGKITGKPTTLSGYGITDAYTKSQVDSALGGYLPLSGGTITGNNLWIGASNNYQSVKTLIFNNTSEIANYGTNIRHYYNNEYKGLLISPTSGLYYSDNGTDYPLIHSNNYTYYTYSKSTIDTKLGGYLPLSGGTLTGALVTVSAKYGYVGDYGLNMNNSDIVGANAIYFGDTSNSNQEGLHFIRSNGNYDTLRAMDGVLMFATNIAAAEQTTSNVYNTVYHTGNLTKSSIGLGNVDNTSDSNKNVNSSVRLRSMYGIDTSNNMSGRPTTANLTFTDKSLRYFLATASMTEGKPPTDSCVLHLAWDNTAWGRQIAVGLGGMYYRYQNEDTSWNGWKQIALTDSNVASATKLATSRKLWGQSFNGENDVNGHLSIGTILGQVAANRAELSIVSETDVPCDLWLGNSAENVWSINCRSSNENRSFSIFHGSLGHLFRIDGASGNVGIGTTSPQYKLDVLGGGLFTDSTNTYGVIIGNNNVIDGYTKGSSSANLYINNYTPGNVYIATGGGSVGVRTNTPQYNLDVNGTLHANNTVTFDGALKVSGITSIGAAQGQHDAYRAQLSVISTTNQPAMFWLGSSGEKKWSVEGRGEADSYHFSLYSWVAAKHILKIEHSGVATLDGTFNATTGIWSNGYVSAKGQNTSSDMRLKNVLNEVVLGVKDIANAPSMRFSWKNGGGVDVGSSAQYWQGLLPDAVKERDGMLEMQYANIALLSAIALAKNVETHEERIARLERENMELKQRIVILEGGNYA